MVYLEKHSETRGSILSSSPKSFVRHVSLARVE